jgi:hypothetical protein
MTKNQAVEQARAIFRRDSHAEDPQKMEFDHSFKRCPRSAIPANLIVAVVLLTINFDFEAIYAQYE